MVEGKIPMAARRHVTNKLRTAYARASKQDKAKILDEVMATTGMGRSTARRMLTGPALPDPAEQVDKRKLRPKEYSDDSRLLLEHVWALMGCPCGGDLLFRPMRRRRLDTAPVTIDSTNWRKRVWIPAREAAGLTGDPGLSELDPRRRPLRVKDLRAYAASVVVDSGGTQYEAAALLRHATVQTTNRFYARAQDERSQDPARASLRLDLTMTLPERIDALWIAWVTAYPDQTSDLLDRTRDGADESG